MSGRRAILAALLTALALLLTGFMAGRSTATPRSSVDVIPADAFEPVHGGQDSDFPVEPDLRRTSGAPLLGPPAPALRRSPHSPTVAASTPQPTASAAASVSGPTWHRSASSWFGPGLYGNRTACGQTLTRSLVGVASRTLPCGAMVTFRYRGVTVTAPVVDFGPAAWTGRAWDLTAGLCRLLGHCWTGVIEWRLV